MTGNISQPKTEPYEWVKKIARGKELDYYLESPGYKMIKKGDRGAVIAFKRPIAYEPRPHHLEACTPYEVQRLESKV